MKLTPLEIRKQEFKKALRGLDSIEVQTFLDMVAEQYEQALDENKELNRKLIELETKLHDYQENEKNLRETLLNVQEVKKQSEETSRRQADLVIKEAELKALEVLENARNEAREIREEVNWLKSQKESFINRIRHVLISQIELLSVMELDDLIPEEMRKTVKGGKGPKLPEGPSDRDSDTAPPVSLAEESAPEQSNLQASGQPSEEESQRTIIIERHSDKEKKTAAPPEEGKKEKEKDKASKSSPRPVSSLNEEDINEFFKKGIQIDDLIKTINKKDSEK